MQDSLFRRAFIICLLLKSFSALNAQLSCGVWSTINNTPWAATLNVKSNASIIPKTMAATIVSPSLVLVNANLFLGKEDNQIHLEDLSSFTVSANVSVFGDANNENSQTVGVSSVRVHPEFNKLNWTLAENDIAAVHLKTPLEFDEFVNSVCIPTKEIFDSILRKSLYESSRKDFPVVLTGWNRFQVKPTTNLLNMNIKDEEFCKEWWKNNNETSHAPYVNRDCSFVSKGFRIFSHFLLDNSNEDCVHRDNGFIAKWEDKPFFLGFVNNFYSDKGICNSKALYFGAKLTESISKFINGNM